MHELEETARSRREGATYEADANEYLNGLLRSYNSRDVGRIRARLAEIVSCVEADLDGTVDLVFGGSVRKHTYVDGLSDVDALLLVNRTSLAQASPKDVLSFLQQRLADRLRGAEVKAGALAVTVTFHDGLQLQVLPAIKTASGLRIADGPANWSSVVRPTRFAEKLTAVNKAQADKVVPVIKLFKGLQQALPSTQRMSGYHVESVAIEAFRNYEGRRALKAMLRHLLGEAAARVRRPIQDQTGQSRHVDDYLGPAGSAARVRVGAALTRLSARVEAAERNRSVDMLKALFKD